MQRHKLGYYVLFSLVIQIMLVFLGNNLFGNRYSSEIENISVSVFNGILLIIAIGNFLFILTGLTVLSIGLESLIIYFTDNENTSYKNFLKTFMVISGLQIPQLLIYSLFKINIEASSPFKMLLDVVFLVLSIILFIFLTNSILDKKGQFLITIVVSVFFLAGYFVTSFWF